jgi:hypothetical protein
MRRAIRKVGKVDPKVVAELERRGEHRRARLYEVAGRLNGPWPADEYNAAFPPLDGERPTKPKPPADVVALEKAFDEAVVAYSVARAKWEAAELAAFNARKTQHDTPMVLNPRTGQPLPGPVSDADIHRLKAAAVEAHKDAEISETAMRRARQVHRAAFARWAEERRMLQMIESTAINAIEKGSRAKRAHPGDEYEGTVL